MKKMTQTLCLLFISGLCTFTLGSLDFHLIKDDKNYEEAKAYCREMYTDLVTVHNSTVMDSLVTLVAANISRAWIGLETGDGREWHWSFPDQNLDFFNWKAGEPKNNSEDACAAMDQDGKWFESDCKTKRSFVCHGNSDTNTHIFVADTKTWRDAQDHCRDLSSDLISIHSAPENELVHTVSVSQNVWIGLFKDPWIWSDGSRSSFRHWRRNQPNYVNGQNCVVAVFLDQGKWNDRNCNTKHNFLCYSERKPMQKSTQATFTTTQPPLNVTTRPSTTSQQVIVTFPTTSDGSTSHSNMTYFTTNQAATVSNVATPDTSDFMSRTQRTELTTATTQFPTMTADQRPPTTTIQVTSNGVSVSTPPTGPTDTSLPGKLILVQEHMTWIEAMAYCRKHHIDLVHVTTEYIQEQVAEKAKNATSPHVWLGLRYTCNFNFWYWASSASVCYLNWAPGQGPERNYDCGVTGAIQATGRQQWVGLSETERLNFICYACDG